ncbi:MAG: hypothetical protein ACR2OH_00430 [Microthrixaceae bacterium]
MRQEPKRESWTGSSGTRARVLLEGGTEYPPSVIAPIIERHGFEVRTCEGATPEHGCDLLDNGACPLVDGADVVVNLLTTRGAAPRVLDAVTGVRRPPGVVATRAAAATHAGPVTVIPGAVTRSKLIRAIDEALRRSPEPMPAWGDGFC